MQCPICGHEGRGGVVCHAKKHGEFEIVRYRKCAGCHRNYRTRETIVPSRRGPQPSETHGTLSDARRTGD